MDVGRILPHTTETLIPVRLPVTTPEKTPDLEDLVDVPTAQISDLLIGSALVYPLDADTVNDLLQAAGNAVLQRDVAGALGHVTNLIQHHPEEFETIRTQPALQPIQAAVDNLLRVHITNAQAEAQALFTAASHIVESGARSARGQLIDGPQVLQTAHRLMDSGRFAHLLLAAELSQTVLNAYIPVPVIPLDSAKSFQIRSEQVAVPKTFKDVLRGSSAFQRRFTLLFLFLAWLALGIMSGILTFVLQLLEFEGVTSALTFEIWGAGSVGLIGYGTYRRLAGKKS